MSPLRTAALFGLVVLAGAILPAEALGCPSCVVRENMPGRLLVFVGMALVPWTVVGLTVLAIRKTMRKEAGGAGAE